MRRQTSSEIGGVVGEVADEVLCNTNRRKPPHAQDGRGDRLPLGLPSPHTVKCHVRSPTLRYCQDVEHARDVLRRPNKVLPTLQLEVRPLSHIRKLLHISGDRGADSIQRDEVHDEPENLGIWVALFAFQVLAFAHTEPP